MVALTNIQTPAQADDPANLASTLIALKSMLPVNQALDVGVWERPQVSQAARYALGDAKGVVALFGQTGAPESQVYAILVSIMLNHADMIIDALQTQQQAEG